MGLVYGRVFLRLKILGIVGAIAIVLGLAPARGAFESLGSYPFRSSGWIAWVVWAMWMLGTFGPLLALLRGPFVLSRRWQITLWCLCIAAWLLGMLLTVLMPPGETHAMLLITSVFCAGMCAFYDPLARGIGNMFFVIAFLMASVSLLGGVRAISQAQTIAAGTPYCISRHGDRAVNALADLRLLALFNTTGPLLYDRHGKFHAFLETEHGLYNWHSTAMRFEYRDPSDAFFDPELPYENLCEKQLNFVWGLNIW